MACSKVLILIFKKTYNNEEWVMKSMEAQGFIKDKNGVFIVPDNKKISMQIPTELIPKCPADNSDMTTNLRVDNYFVEDEIWHKASETYYNFLEKNKNKHILFLELGVGANTPMIIKYPFWQMTMENEKAIYACINYGEVFCPQEIENRSICIDGDIGSVLEANQIKKALDLYKYISSAFLIFFKLILTSLSSSFVKFCLTICSFSSGTHSPSPKIEQ